MQWLPEVTSNQDRTKKLDCERNAAKRLIPKIKATYPKLNIIVTADGLYSNQPFIDELKTADMSFILVAKPADHKLLFEWVTELIQLGDGGSQDLGDEKGRRHRYQWVNQVPLNGTKDADLVNFFQYQLVAKKGLIDQVDTTTFFPVHWFVNGRAFPDLLQAPDHPFFPIHKIKLNRRKRRPEFKFVAFIVFFVN